MLDAKYSSAKLRRPCTAQVAVQTCMSERHPLSLHLMPCPETAVLLPSAGTIGQLGGGRQGRMGGN